MLAASALLVSCQAQDPVSGEAGASTEFQSVSEALSGTSDLSISSRLINSGQLGQALDGEGSYTIFIPVDEAWSALESDQIQSLETAEGRPQLVAVLLQHIAPGAMLEADIDQALERSGGMLTLATMGAGPITLRRDEQAVRIGGEEGSPRIVGSPILAGNDVIYRIDSLIPPPE